MRIVAKSKDCAESAFVAKKQRVCAFGLVVAHFEGGSMKKCTAYCLVLLLAVLCLASGTYAQGAATTGTVTGTIMDP